MPLEGKSDGSSFVKEYISLMDTAIPASVNYDIQDIILEESDFYFSGNKNEYEVSIIIQKRISLYLEERRQLS